MNKKKNISISILITNYNNYKYLNKSLSYTTSQNYNNYEVILFDDQSIHLIKKYKKGNYSNYTHLGINWWISRNEAFEYIKYILNVWRIKFKKRIDYYLTKFIYYFLKDKIIS